MTVLTLSHFKGCTCAAGVLALPAPGQLQRRRGACVVQDTSWCSAAAQCKSAVMRCRQPSSAYLQGSGAFPVWPISSHMGTVHGRSSSAHHRQRCRPACNDATLLFLGLPCLRQSLQVRTPIEPLVGSCAIPQPDPTASGQTVQTFWIWRTNRQTTRSGSCMCVFWIAMWSWDHWCWAQVAVRLMRHTTIYRILLL